MVRVVVRQHVLCWERRVFRILRFTNNVVESGGSGKVLSTVLVNFLPLQNMILGALSAAACRHGIQTHSTGIA